MAVVLVAERERPDDKASPCADDGNLVAKLVLPVLLALADAEHVGLVQGIDFVAVNLLAVHELQADVQTLPCRAALRQQTKQLADKAPGYGAHSAVGLPDLLHTVALASETLHPLQLLHLTTVSLADMDARILRNPVAILDNLVEQLRVGGECDVLLLDGRVDERGLLLIALAPPAILAAPLIFLLAAGIINGQVDTDALLQNQLRARLADAVAEMDQLAGGTRSTCGKAPHTAEVLVVGVFPELSHNLLI